MYAGFSEKMWALYCNAGHPVMENIVYQLFLVVCRPNQLNFTQLIAVTFATVSPVARISQQGAKNHKWRHILKIQYWWMQEPPRKSRSRHVNFIPIYLDP